MKKSNTLQATGLIVFLFILLAGCTSQETIISTYHIQPSPTDKSYQSLFMPVINSDPASAGDQTPPYPEPTTVIPTVPVTPGEPPTPTTIWPTLVNNTFATPYVRPSGARGQELPPERWQEWPVVPVISDRAIEIYRAGIAQGTNPQHFSRVGDCQNIRQYFLGLFDYVGRYRLGDQQAYLQETIDYFAGNWDRLSESVRTGFNVASVLAPLHANPENCLPVETPLACEIRIWNPSFVLISFEVWTPDRPVDAYENYLRQIIEYAISKNVLPIVATKADNLEGNYAINQIVARVAADYDIPMWNFWAAANPLTDQGLLEDRFHLTNGPNYFDSPVSMDLGWPVRNYTALQTIDAFWKAVR